MLGIAVLVEAAALLCGAVCFAGVIRSVLRTGARERDLLINQVLHLSGRTWQEPPREMTPLFDDEVAVLLNPDQYPV